MFDTVTLLAERDLLKDKLKEIKKVLNDGFTDTQSVQQIRNIINTLILDEKE